MSDRTQLDRIEEELRRLSHLITGNGTPERGMVVRLDRVEQRQSLFIWVAGAVFVALLAVAVPSAWSFVDRMNRIEQQHSNAVPAGKP